MVERKPIQEVRYTERFQWEQHPNNVWMIDRHAITLFVKIDGITHIRIVNMNAVQAIIPWGTMVNLVR